MRSAYSMLAAVDTLRFTWNHARMGAKTTYSAEIADEICERVLMRALKSVCSDSDMPAEGTVYGWLANNPEFAERYARARTGRAYRRSEEIDEIVSQVRAGEIDPNAARVAIDAIKWQSGKENSRVFGDKVQHTGDGGGAIQFNVVTAVPGAESQD